MVLKFGKTSIKRFMVMYSNRSYGFTETERLEKNCISDSKDAGALRAPKQIFLSGPACKICPRCLASYGSGY